MLNDNIWCKRYKILNTQGLQVKFKETLSVSLYSV